MMIKTFIAILLIGGAVGAQTKYDFTTTAAQDKEKVQWVSNWNLTSPGGHLLWVSEPAPIIWMTIKKDETQIGWLIPACTTENLKRAPKLTAWVVGMQKYESPQAKWLTALFKDCKIEQR